MEAVVPEGKCQMPGLKLEPDSRFKSGRSASHLKTGLLVSAGCSTGPAEQVLSAGDMQPVHAGADPERVKKEIEDVIGLDTSNAILASAKKVASLRPAPGN